MAGCKLDYVVLLLTTIVLQAWAMSNYEYMVVCPNTIRPGMRFTCTVNSLRNCKRRVVVKATIEGDSGNFHLSKRSAILRAENKKLITLDVPLSLPVSNDYTISILARRRRGMVLFANQTSLTMDEKSMSVLIQTDKAVYKPGQNVRFRCFAIDSSLQTIRGKMDIDLFDPNGNKISQWRDVSGSMGVFQGQLQLSDQPPLGDWNLKVNVRDKGSGEKSFTVAEYVLPKFEVTVSLPPFGVMTDADLSGKITAKYTFGKGVDGKGTLRIQRKYSGSIKGEGRDYGISISPFNGEYSFKLPLKDLFTQLGVTSPTTLVVSADVTEGLTGKTLSASEEIQYYNSPIKLVILDGADNFKPGLKYTGYVFLSDQNDQPLGVTKEVNITVEMTVNLPTTTPEETTTTGNMRMKIMPPIRQKPTETIETGPDAIIVPENGIASFSFFVPVNVASVNVLAQSNKLNQRKYLTAFKSPSNTYVQVTLATQNPKTGRYAVFQIRSTKRRQTVIILIVSRGKIVRCESKFMKRKIVRVKILMTSEMAPNARMVVYYGKTSRTEDTEIIADSVSFNVDGLFENKVNVGFSKRSSQPGNAVSVVVGADPGSQCSILTVDKSVLLLKSGNDITPQMVEDEILKFDNVDPPSPCSPFAPCLRHWFPMPTPGTDVAGIFKEAGFVVMTNALLYKEPNYYYRHFLEEDVMMAMPMMKSGSAESGTSPRVRQKFPETWWFDSGIADDEGKCYFNGTTPDTITTWVATAFAVHRESGLGVAPMAANLRSFLNFFLRLELPYSVVRGEQVILQANVFNFYDTDLTVQVTLAQSEDFENIEVVRTQRGGPAKLRFTSKEVVRSIVIPEGTGVTVNFPIRPTTLGDIDIRVTATSPQAGDAVKRQLLVKAEGIPESYNIAFMVDLRNGAKSFYREQEITFPENVVTGSQKIRVSAIGDLMGPTINGLENLLRMPYGCGEQNMINFAPNVYVLMYLDATDNLRPEDLTKAQGFMLAGYQRELTYQHSADGSFSAFGESDPSGSTWLTAFVVKSFAQAKPFIFIDAGLMGKALTFLLNQYDDELGFFNEPGRVIHTEMQGGSASGEGSLAAYTLIGLLEADNNGFVVDDEELLETTINSATESLEDNVDDMTNIYELCIVSYALALADSTATDDVLVKLDNLATKRDGMVYWEVSDDSEDSMLIWMPPYVQAKSRNIEATAYVLLAYATTGDVPSGLKVIKWLVQQRNANGGFGSTQDTVIALQALSAFAALLHTEDFNILVNILGNPIGYGHAFNINSTNALLYQSIYLPGAADINEVTIHAIGTGLALVEVAVTYNVNEEPITPLFGLEVKFTDETVNGFKLNVCFWWLGKGQSSMAAMEVNLLSGFGADKFSVTDLTILKRVDEEESKLVLYLDQITTEKECLNIRMERSGLVVGSQPAPVILYDYYQPDKRVSMLYHPQLQKDSTICDVFKGEDGAEFGC